MFAYGCEMRAWRGSADFGHADCGEYLGFGYTAARVCR